MRVLRRKRRQPELTTRAAVSEFQLIVAAVTQEPGITHVELRAEFAGAVFDLAGCIQLWFYGYETGIGLYTMRQADAAVDTIDAGALEVDVTYNFDYDLGLPHAVIVPPQWTGIRTAAGDFVTSLTQQSPANSGLAWTSLFI